MQKKYKKAIIVSIVSVSITTLVLVLLGLGQVGLTQCALNYSRILTNYTDTNVYGPGLYWIGISNKFIKINWNQQILSYQKIFTYTTDFYALTASLQVTYLFSFANNLTDFSTISHFYETMGDNPAQFLEPLIKNQIIIILSSYNSQFYQNTNLANIQLQNQIAAQIQSVVATWVNCTVNVIIQSLVCEGTTTNTQILDREIQSLMHELQRTQNQKIELTTYFNTIFAKKQFQINSAYSAISLKTADLQRILTNIRGGNSGSLMGANISKLLYNNEPTIYDHNLLNILQELIIVGNRTFPY